MSPVLTIVVPCYNVEPYLERSLEHYCDESLKGCLEVILVNDGSTDGTAKLLDRYAMRRPDLFKVITKENGGHGSAVNAGIREAKGKYFRVVDGDDWVNPAGLALSIKSMGETDVDLVVDVKREVHLVTGESELFPLPPEIKKVGVPLPFESVCNEGSVESYIMIHTLSVKTELLRSIGLSLLEKTFYEDYEYVVKSTVAARSILFLDNEVYQYLVGNAQQSVSSTNYVKRWDDHIRVLKELLGFAAEKKAAESPLHPNVEAYLDRKIELMVNTLYNIALIYDSDRKRGLQRGKALRAELRKAAPLYGRITGKRYAQARVLHAFGFDSEKLDALMGRKLKRA